MTATNFPSEKARDTRMIMTDVDGVLTDGKIIIGSSGEEYKNFHVADGTGIRFAIRAGIEIAFISARHSAVTRIRAEQLGVSEVWQVKGSKELVYEKLLEKYALTDSQVVFIGDDLYDLEVIKMAGIGVAVRNAVNEVKKNADYVTSAEGGSGAVREVIDLVLKSKNQAPLLKREPAKKDETAGR